jgi:hypothetical protein
MLSLALCKLTVSLNSRLEHGPKMLLSLTIETSHQCCSNSYNNDYILESLLCYAFSRENRAGRGTVCFCCLATQRQLENAFAASGWSKPRPRPICQLPRHTLYRSVCNGYNCAVASPKPVKQRNITMSLFFFKQF